MKVDPLTALIRKTSRLHGPVILMYHATCRGPAVAEWPWAISIKRLCKQLDLLSDAGYATPTMRDLIASPADKWPERTAIITFDDGYANNLAACEELGKRDMQATWFIVSDSIGREPDWPSESRPGGRLLNATELRQLQAAGMEIGSHSVSHVRLTETDDDELNRELVTSKATLEDLLGNPVTSFAYPYGALDERCASAVKKAGYTAACTTQSGWAFRDNHPFRLRRLTVFNTDTTSTLARKLLYASNDVSWKTLFSHYSQQARSRLGLRAS